MRNADRPPAQTGPLKPRLDPDEGSRFGYTLTGHKRIWEMSHIYEDSRERMDEDA